MAQTCSMKQAGSRNIGNVVDQMEWSNKMDLIAYGTDKGEVIIQRLNWQKIITYPPVGEGLRVRSLSWQPDGTTLAVAYNDGKMMMMDAEREDSVASITFDEEIQRVFFGRAIDADDYRHTYRHREEHSYDFYQPPLPLLSDLGATIKPSEARRPFSKGEPCFLVVIMPSGKIHLLLKGALKAGIVDLAQYMQHPKDFEVLNVSMNGANNAIYALVRDGQQLKVYHFENDMLKKYMSPILHLAVYCGNCLETKNYIKSTVQCMVESWETVLMEMDNKLTNYANNQRPGSVSADLLELLVFGYASQSIEEFLMEELTEKGVKKLSNSVELSYATIQNMALNPLQCATIKMFYFLTAIRGLARMKLFFEDLLIPEVVDKALRLCGSFAIKNLEMSQVIDQSMHNNKIFFSWLCVVIARLNQQDITDDTPVLTTEDSIFLAEYLNSFEDNVIEKDDGTSIRRKFNLEKVGQYFEEKNLQETVKGDANQMWSKLLEENACLANSNLIYPHEKELSLLQQLRKLFDATQEVFEKCNNSISASFRLDTTVVCCEMPASKELSSSFCHNSQNDTDVLATMIGPHDVLVLEFDGDFKQLKTTRITLQCDPSGSDMLLTNVGNFKNLHFRDIQFYNDTTISMLMATEVADDAAGDDGDGKRPQSYFVQYAVDVTNGKQTQHSLPNVDIDLSAGEANGIYDLMDAVTYKAVDGNCTHLAVSGNRKLVSLLSDEKRKMSIYEMEAEDDDDDIDVSHASMLDVSKESAASSVKE